MAVNHFTQSFNKGKSRNGNHRGCGKGRGGNNGGGGQFSGGHNGQFPSGGQFYNGNGQFSSSLQSKTNSPHSQGQRVACQICGKNGHTTLDCYHRMKLCLSREACSIQACFHGC